MSVAVRPVRRRSAVGAVLALARWPNALIAAGGVLMGGWWVDPATVATRPMLLAVVVALSATAAFNAFDDLNDVAVDVVAHPDRPLPRGELSPRAAALVGATASALAVAAAGRTSGELLETIALAFAGAFVYIGVLKPRGLVANLAGNLVVALVASLPFAVGGSAAGSLRAALPLFAVAVPLHLAREVMKDVADVDGDRGFRRSVALAWGGRAARGVALAALAAHALLVTFLFAPAGLRRLALVPAVALAAWAVGRASDRLAPSLLKLSMLLAMAALPLLR